MPQQFKGLVNMDIRDSIPDWAPYEHPKPTNRRGAQGIVVWDDVAFCPRTFRRPIETPARNRVDQAGLFNLV